MFGSKAQIAELKHELDVQKGQLAELDYYCKFKSIYGKDITVEYNHEPNTVDIYYTINYREVPVVELLGRPAGIPLKHYIEAYYNISGTQINSLFDDIEGYDNFKHLINKYENFICNDPDYFTKEDENNG